MEVILHVNIFVRLSVYVLGSPSKLVFLLFSQGTQTKNFFFGSTTTKRRGVKQKKNIFSSKENNMKKYEPLRSTVRGYPNLSMVRPQKKKTFLVCLPQLKAPELSILNFIHRD